MITVACPNCGLLQESAEKCRQCSSLFAYYEKQLASEEPRSSAAPPAPSKTREILRLAYRISYWTTLVFLIVVIVLVLRKSPAPAHLPADPQAKARLETKLSVAQQDPAAGTPEPLRLDQAELNTYLRSNLDLQSPASAEPSLQEVQSSVKDFQIALQGDQIQAYLVFDFHGKDLSLSLQGRLHASDGYLRFEPTDGKLGSLPLPQATLDDAVARLMNSPENKEKFRLPADIRDIRIEDGELVVEYR